MKFKTLVTRGPHSAFNDPRSGGGWQGEGCEWIYQRTSLLRKHNLLRRRTETPDATRATIAIRKDRPNSVIPFLPSITQSIFRLLPELETRAFVVIFSFPERLDGYLGGHARDGRFKIDAFLNAGIANALTQTLDFLVSYSLTSNSPYQMARIGLSVSGAPKLSHPNYTPGVSQEAGRFGC
jgi:hypothetical protein